MGTEGPPRNFPMLLASVAAEIAEPAARVVSRAGTANVVGVGELLVLVVRCGGHVKRYAEHSGQDDGDHRASHQKEPAPVRGYLDSIDPLVERQKRRTQDGGAENAQSDAQGNAVSRRDG